MKATKKKIDKRLLRYTTTDFKIGDLVCFPDHDTSLMKSIGVITGLNSNETFDYFEVFWFDIQDYSEEMLHTLRKYDKNNQ